MPPVVAVVLVSEMAIWVTQTGSLSLSVGEAKRLKIVIQKTHIVKDSTTRIRYLAKKKK